MPACAGSSISGIGSTSPCSGSADRPGARPRSAATCAAELAQADAVGELLIAPFDLDGRFVASDLSARTIAFDARRLERLPIRIGVAGGPSKVRPILGALRSGALTTLVSDVRTAEAVAELAREGAPA